MGTGERKESSRRGWRRLRAVSLCLTARVPKSGRVCIDPFDDFAYGHGVESVKVEVAKKVDDRHEVCILGKQATTDWSACRGNDGVDAVRIDNATLSLLYADNVASVFVDVENLFLTGHYVSPFCPCTMPTGRRLVN